MSRPSGYSPSGSNSRHSAGGLIRITNRTDFGSGDQSPGLLEVLSKFLVAYSVDFNSDPAADPDIRRPVEFLWRFFDQHFLNPDSGRNGHCNVSVVVMIV